MASSSSMAFASVALVLLLLVGSSSAQLSNTFYDTTCPNLLATVQSVVKAAILKEPRMGASLLRLEFHDCFVNGCDGSILLDDTANFTGEKNAFPNINSVRGFDVIDSIKAAVEKICPGVVSCADIVVIAGRDSVVQLGGPNWHVQLGRRDARTASQSAANTFIPAPFSSLSTLISKFSAVGLSTKDMIALSGAHTIGQARCVNFRGHIYNDADIDASFAKTRQANCPSAAGSGDNNLAPLDLSTPTKFDNNYYKLLLAKKGLFHSDQELFNNGSADAQVRAYARNPTSFFNDFVPAMINMEALSPLTGSKGEIRKNCRKMN